MYIYIDRIVEQIRNDIKVSGKTLNKIAVTEDLIEKYQTDDLLTICYLIAKNIDSIPYCQECVKNKVRLISTKKGFGKFCSKSCHSTNLSKCNKVKNRELNQIKSKRLKERRAESLEKVLEYYTNNVIRISDLAEKFSLPYCTVRQHLVSNQAIKAENQKNFLRKNFKDKVDDRLYDSGYLSTCSKNNLSLKEVAKDLDVSPNTVRLYALKHNIQFDSISALERSISNFVKTLDENADKTRKIIKPYEIDVYSEKYKLGIELHGEFWHNEDKVSINYHLKKQQLAEHNNISLIQIFAHEWKTKKKIIESIIKSKMGINKKVYARKLKFIEVSKEDAKLFFNENHLQGWLKCQKVFALIDTNDNIISAISFGKSRFHKDCDYEVLRFANMLDTNVVGGFSKLIVNSQKVLGFQKVVTYSHKRLFTGGVYEKAGFIKVRETRPGYFWFNIKNANIKSRHQTQKHKLNTTLSEIEFMKNNDYRRVFDCGQNVYILNVT